MANSDRVRLDLNYPEFQASLCLLPPEDLVATVRVFKRLLAMTWGEVYGDHGLRWEQIESVRRGARGERVYSFRISRGCRALARREESWMRLIGVFAEHDAAYGKK